MARENYGSSSRETTANKREEELMFKHFRENKVEIASAITKPFPFLMSLRDRGFITERKFQTSQEKCENRDKVGKVVYDILSDLQKKFTLPLLEVIFSTTHLKAYPDLKEIVRSFLDDTMETGNNTSEGKSTGKRNDRRAGGQTALRRKRREKNPGRSAKTRGRRLGRNEAARFKAELLPVTCGYLKGVLHKRKFEHGIFVKSIQTEDGDWLTPSEFEILGGHEKSRNWRLSLRCYDRPLKFLIQKNFLPKLSKARCRIKKM
ncbi:nuclear body protein SP140 isoform X2 [Sigmodon hispidus]